jgi:hypothetical protein
MLIFGCLVNPIPVKGTESKPSAEKALELCLESLDISTQQINAQRELLQTQDEYIVKLVKQRNELYEKVDTSSSIPWYLWALTGVAAGVIIGQTVVFK